MIAACFSDPITDRRFAPSVADVVAYLLSMTVINVDMRCLFQMAARSWSS